MKQKFFEKVLVIVPFFFMKAREKKQLWPKNLILTILQIMSKNPCFLAPPPSFFRFHQNKKIKKLEH